MRIAILSDIHDRQDHLADALTQCATADAMICCGDLCSPFIIVQLAEGFAGPIHVVFGNNDGDLFRISEQARRFPHVSLHGEFAQIEMGGKRFAVQHFPEIARAVAASGRYDVVCYGHDHQYAVERHPEALIINPGAVMGGAVPSTFVIYDTVEGKAVRHEVSGQENR